MKRIICLALALALALCAAGALAEMPFKINGVNPAGASGDGWSWDESRHLLTITKSGLTVSDWGEKDSLAEGRIETRPPNPTEEFALTVSNVHLTHYNDIISVASYNISHADLIVADSTLKPEFNGFAGVNVEACETFDVRISGSEIASGYSKDSIYISARVGGELYISDSLVQGYCKYGNSGAVSFKGNAQWYNEKDFIVHVTNSTIENLISPNSGRDAAVYMNGIYGGGVQVVLGPGAKLSGVDHAVWMDPFDPGKSSNKDQITRDGACKVYADGTEELLSLLGGDAEPLAEIESGKIYKSKELLKEEIYTGNKMLETISLGVNPGEEPVEPAAADSLPKTGDPSMLGAWLALLGMSAAGMKMRKKH